MTTIVDIIESRLDAGNANTSFTYLTDGETPQPAVMLRQIRNGALQIAGALPKDAVVLLLLPQGIEFIKAFFACLYAQAVAVPLAIPGKHRGFNKLKAAATSAHSAYAVTNRETLNNLSRWHGEEELIRQMRWILIEDFKPEPADFPLPAELPKPGQLAFVQYTSGSTGAPKGVMVTHENIIANSRILQTFFRNNAATVSVCWLPSFHDMGLIDGVIQPVYSGFESILMSPVHFLQKPFRWLKALTDFRATYSGGPNFAYDFCASRIKKEELADLDLSRLHCFYNAAEPIRHQTMQRFLAAFSPVGVSEKQLLTCYGLAEATLAATASKIGIRPTVLKISQEKLRRNEILLTETEPFLELVSSGYTYCDTKLKIIDPDSLRECAELERGEIWAAGTSVTAGYLNAPEITRKNFVVHQGQRFLRTGDLGFMLGGELFVAGRIKDLIIIRGANHYPQDIEQTVQAAHPALAENAAAAFSVEIDGEEKLVVLQELKRSFRREADYAAIFYQVTGAISQMHGLVAHDIVLMAPNRLPKTSSGKISRTAARRLWESQKLDSIAVLKDHLFFERISS